MTTNKPQANQHDQKKPVGNQSSADHIERDVPKPESSSEYEGAPSRKPADNQPVEKKVETSSSSGQ